MWGFTLAPSWWSPCLLLRWAFLSLSFVDPVRNVAPLAPCLSWQYQSFACSCCCGGASPHVLGSVWAYGVRGGSTFIALHRAWSVSAILPCATWSSGWRFILFLRDVPHVFMAKNLSVSPTYTCPTLNNPVGLSYLDTWSDECLGCLRIPLLTLPGICRLRWLIVATARSWCIRR